MQKWCSEIGPAWRCVLVFLATLHVWGIAIPKDAAPALTLDHTSGFFSEPFELVGRFPPGALAYFTTNGTAPSPATGVLWKSPLAIRGTTVLRVAAFRQGEPTGPVLTESYLFPGQVAEQNGAGFPESWGVTNGQLVVAAYGLDPEIVHDPKYQALIVPALKALPSLSVVLDPEDLFGPEKGIYSHTQESGPVWERAANIELIQPDATPGFAIDCGIRIQGGWNRRPEESPKHALRLVFNRRYGAARLVYPVFGDNGVHEFETLILRAGCNNTWLHWNGAERHRGDYIRDQWMRETLQAMGHLSARGRFVHVYLNGLYWGIYNLVERPSAPFVADHLGGTPKDYDCRNGNHILQGTDLAWQDLMRTVANGVPTPGDYAKVRALVDLPEFIDYMIANFYGANADWDSASNWYAARRRNPPGPFEFFVWDGERTLEGVDANILNTGDDGSPAGLFQKLRTSAEFRHLFAERAQRHFQENGALSAQAAGSRYQFWARQLDLPIVAESARWGGYRQKIHRYKEGPYELYTRDDYWRPEVDRLLRDYFPKRGAEVLRQFRAAGLYPP